MLVPSDVVEEARDLHPTFTESRHPSRVLARSLSSWQRKVLAKVQRVASQELRVVETIDLPLGDFEAGHDMPDNTGVYEGVVFYNTDTAPRARFVVASEEERANPEHWPAGYLRSNTLHLMAEEQDWTGFDRIELPYVPDPGDIDLETDTSALPDQAEAAARYHLAELMAARHDGSEPVPDLGYFATKASDELDELERAMQLRYGATAGKVRDVRRR